MRRTRGSASEPGGTGSARRWAGWGLVVLGVVLNPYTVGRFASDGDIEATRTRLAIIAVQLSLGLVGVLCLRGVSRPTLGRSAGLRVVALGLVGGLTLVAAEGLTRLVMGPVEDWSPAPSYPGERVDRPSTTFIADPLVGWRMRPGVEFSWTIDGTETAYSATELGFRSAPTAAGSVDDDEALVTVVGDSFAFGTGVDGSVTFPALLDAALEGVATRNLALPGMGIDQMWMVARHYALPMRPRLLVVAFIDQDWDRSLTAFRPVEGMSKPTFVRDRRELRLATAADAPPAAWRWLQRRSALFALGRAVDRALGYRFSMGSWWSTNAAILRAMVDEAAASGAQVLFVRLPVRGAPDFPTLSRLMSDMDVPFLDLAAEASDGSLFLGDGHLNEAGHEHVAAALEPELRRLVAR